MGPAHLHLWSLTADGEKACSCGARRPLADRAELTVLAFADLGRIIGLTVRALRR
jgi:hypothetical protein